MIRSQYLGIAILGAAALITFIPAVDLDSSRAFYDPTAGFTWDREGALEFFRAYGPRLVLALFALTVIVWVAARLRKMTFFGLTGRGILYLAATLAIGPGLIVETLLKPHWGRARPKDIDLFGGPAVYSPPLLPVDQCDANCSFVSGHAAVVFWLTAYAFLLPPLWRGRVMAAGIVLGLLMGLVRIAQGAHFLSDVVFAGLIVLIVNSLLARFILDRHG